jgi:hypothetical protein
MNQTNGRQQPEQPQATPQETTGTSTNDPTNTVRCNQSLQDFMEPIFMARRPGQRIMTKQTTEDIERTFGDPIQIRNENHIRIIFQNEKGCHTRPPAKTTSTTSQAPQTLGQT